ncbi:exodeoxyribonuclease III [Candidatus Rariloculus sp.]|uniref:exodeoxyribonuclease III n=1 Tax=Candidatus Rariloculus sp. TaxID=3101265 RepID=UPI003D117FAB
MKIATWNVNSLRVRLDHVLAWIESAEPDILALQETKLTDENFPVEAFETAGYHAVFSGQPTYNGVALISRQPAEEVVMDIDTLDDPQRRVLAASYGELRVMNLYVPNGQSVESDKYQYKLEWLAALQAQLANEADRYEHHVILGDFNIAPDDRDVHDPAAWEGDVPCTAAEREAFSRILALGFSDAFRQFEQPEKAFSWWDYRAAAFRRNMGLRIDLILASEGLSRDCTECRIDVEPRRWERPSDHTPVIADFSGL